MMLNTLAEELAHRGHEVTVITNYPTPKKIANYTEIIIDPIYDFWANAPAQNLFDLTEMTFTDMMNLLFDGIGLPTTEHALQNKAVQELIHREGDHFDLILAEQFYQEAFLMLAHKYKAPIVAAGELKFSNVQRKRWLFILCSRNFWLCPVYEPHVWRGQPLVTRAS